MPVDLPLRAIRVANQPRLQTALDRASVVLAAISVMIVIAACLSLTPPTGRASLDLATYQAMLLGP